MSTFALTLMLILQAAPAAARDDICRTTPTTHLRPSRDLYCIDLSAAAAGGRAHGTVALDYIPGPFTVPVTVDGRYRYAPTITVGGLAPLPRGTPAGYTAWAATPTMSFIEKLGIVRNGRARLAEITLDRFVVLISAEPDTAAAERRGHIVLRGESPSNRMRPPDLYQFSLGVVMPPLPGASGWTSVPMMRGIPMLPSEMALTPGVPPWRPRADSSTPDAQPRRLVTVADGDTIDLVAGAVRRRLGGFDVTMLGFNGQQPGPLLVTSQGARITVRFTNRLDQPTSIHWHGVRLDNRFDGVPDLTQAPVPPGGTFIYTVRFPDAGIYWYHPHVREDIQQDLGLYGNLLVRARGPDPHGPANREAVLMLDDILIGDDGPVPYGADVPTHALNGRFGNVFLVNGEPRWEMDARRGDVVRFLLTNASNARTFNISFGGARLKVVGSDVGNLEREAWVASVVVAPAERYVVQVRFDRPGAVALVNRVRVIDRLFGRFLEEVDTLGMVRVDSQATDQDYGAAFDTLRADRPTTRELARYRAAAHRAPDRELLLTMQTHDLPFVSERLMRLDSAWFSPVEWGGTMPSMNWATTGRQVRWILRDPATGRENMDIGWHFRRGDIVKLRIANDRGVLHGMQHPIHLHGQRFLVLAVNGVPNDNLVWKDTVLLPAGATADLLLDLSNPGRWMLHCHIAEHLQAGMMTVLDVEDR